MTIRRSWGETAAGAEHPRRLGLVDLCLVVGAVGVVFGVADLGHSWSSPHQAKVEIDLNDPWGLPRYTFFSLCRGLLAYLISLAFTLSYGYWAAKDKTAERVLVPLLDILQSIPVLSFLPGLVLALVYLFPSSNVGLELAAVLMIFTGQAWNMTFSFYHSLRAIPADLRETATVYRFTGWQRFKWLELPYSMIGLVWNSMMSMAGGWFFLTICESFRLGDNDFRLPGLGSYMTAAVEAWNVTAMLWAIFAMVLMIVLLDQLLWRPVVVWAQRFRAEESGQQQTPSSWFLNFLRRSRILALLGGGLHWLTSGQEPAQRESAQAPVRPASDSSLGWVSRILLVVLVAALLLGMWKILELVSGVSPSKWGEILIAAAWTLGRVLLAVGLGTLWAVPAGLAIGLSPRLSRLLQPVIQVLASFPVPMLFPLVIAALAVGGQQNPLAWGSVLLMLLGTQWYILFNVVAGAMAIPADLKEAVRSYRLSRWQRFRILYLPAIFPYLVTGWITAAGGAWNTSIVAEYVTLKAGEPSLQTQGLGAMISAATDKKDLALLAAATLVMATVVVLFNRFVWQRLYHLAERRFSLNK